MIGAIVLTFIAGAAYECGCVFWVHYSERGRVGPAVTWSCFNALVTVIGIESFLKGYVLAAAYILGFGAGTFLAMHLKRRLGGA